MQSTSSGPGQSGPTEDWFSTHPFSPLRVKALQLYFQSELAQTGGMSKVELETAVHELMLMMEPSYIEGRTETAEVMRRALFAGALVVAAASGDISDREIAVFEEFFGKGTFKQQLNLEKLKEELPQRLKQARSATSLPQRMQLVHDICLIARAEGEVLPVEREAIEQIADELEVPRGFVVQTLDASFELD